MKGKEITKELTNEMILCITASGYPYKSAGSSSSLSKFKRLFESL